MQDKTEWKLNGQGLVFTLPLTDQVCIVTPNWYRCLRANGLDVSSWFQQRNERGFSLVPQVSVIKVKIHEATGMPAGKQKLQYEVSQGNPGLAPQVPASLSSQKQSPVTKQMGRDLDVAI